MTAKELRDKFDAELKEMQENCQHPEISDWMEYHWAIGHFSHWVKICRVCEKTVEEKRPDYDSQMSILS
jgi:hypothetical protein